MCIRDSRESENDENQPQHTVAAHVPAHIIIRCRGVLRACFYRGARCLTSAGSRSLHMGLRVFPGGLRLLGGGACGLAHLLRHIRRGMPFAGALCAGLPVPGALRLCLFPLGLLVFQRQGGGCFFPFRTLCLQFQLGLCRCLLPGKPLQRKLGFLPGGTGHFGRLGRRLGAVPARGRAQPQVCLLYTSRCV